MHTQISLYSLASLSITEKAQPRARLQRDSTELQNRTKHLHYYLSKPKTAVENVSSLGLNSSGKLVNSESTREANTV